MTTTTHPRTLPAWMRAVNLFPAGDPDGDAVEAAHLVRVAETNGRWLHGGRADVFALGAALFREPPRHAGPLLRLEALRLASAVFEHGIAPVGVFEPDDTDALARYVRRAVTALDHTDPNLTVTDDRLELVHRAAARAVRELAVPRDLLPDGVVALLQVDNPSWLSDYARDQIALACAEVAPGRRWRYVDELGVVSWRPNQERAADA